MERPLRRSPRPASRSARPLPIDFDGDWDATNNWLHLGPGAEWRRTAVYASSILTETHAYLTYLLFYPRDWISLACIPYVCHDNDLEVTLVVVERGGAGDADPNRLVAGGRLWKQGDGWFSYAGARMGALGAPLGAAMATREYPGGVRPPWGLAADGPRGDWFFDPAFVALMRYGSWFLGRAVSQHYLLNAFVEDLARECAGHACRRPPKASHAKPLSAAGLLTMLGLLLLRLRSRLGAGSARAFLRRSSPSNTLLKPPPGGPARDAGPGRGSTAPPLA